jgi:hypothetical protein
MSLSLRDLEDEVWDLLKDADMVESDLLGLYFSTFPNSVSAILSEGLERKIGSFGELAFVNFGEMWANFSRVLTRMLSFCRRVRENAKEVLKYPTITLLDEILEKNDDENWHTSQMRFHVFVESRIQFPNSGETDNPIPLETTYENFTDYIMNTARDYREYENNGKGPLSDKIWGHLEGTGKEMESIYTLFNHANAACENIFHELYENLIALQRAFLLGSHHRLGAGSRVRELPPEVLELVVDALHR